MKNTRPLRAQGVSSRMREAAAQRLAAAGGRAHAAQLALRCRCAVAALSLLPLAPRLLGAAAAGGAAVCQCVRGLTQSRRSTRTWRAAGGGEGWQVRVGEGCCPVGRRQLHGAARISSMCRWQHQHARSRCPGPLMSPAPRSLCHQQLAAAGGRRRRRCGGHGRVYGRARFGARCFCRAAWRWRLRPWRDATTL